MDTYHSAKFYRDWIKGFVSVHARLRAFGAKVDSAISGALKITHSQHVRTDFDAKYAKRRSATVECGPRKHKFNRIRQVAPMCKHGRAH